MAGADVTTVKGPLKACALRESPAHEVTERLSLERGGPFSANPWLALNGSKTLTVRARIGDARAKDLAASSWAARAMSVNGVPLELDREVLEEERDIRHRRAGRGRAACACASDDGPPGTASLIRALSWGWRRRIRSRASALSSAGLAFCARTRSACARPSSHRSCSSMRSEKHKLGARARARQDSHKVPANWGCKPQQMPAKYLVDSSAGSGHRVRYFSDYDIAEIGGVFAALEGRAAQHTALRLPETVEKLLWATAERMRELRLPEDVDEQMRLDREFGPP